MKEDTPKPRYAPNALSYPYRGKEAVSTDLSCVCDMAHVASVTSSLGESESQKQEIMRCKKIKVGEGGRLTLATLSSLCTGSLGSEVNTRSGGTTHASLSGLLDR